MQIAHPLIRSVPLFQSLRFAFVPVSRLLPWKLVVRVAACSSDHQALLSAMNGFEVLRRTRNKEYRLLTMHYLQRDKQHPLLSSLQPSVQRLDQL